MRERLRGLMKPKKETHPKDTVDRDDKARQYWSWAFKLFKTQVMNKIDIDNVELGGNGNEILDESYDKDREADAASEKKEELERF